MLRLRHLLPVVVISSAVAAAPAAAAPAEHWKSKTNNGNEAYYSTKGKKLFNMSGYIPTTCVPSSGYPRSGSAEFTPPGAFRVGTTRKAFHLATQTAHPSATVPRLTSGCRRRGWIGRMGAGRRSGGVDRPCPVSIRRRCFR